jgi:hypothetical protein
LIVVSLLGRRDRAGLVMRSGCVGVCLLVTGWGRALSGGRAV